MNNKVETVNKKIKDKYIDKERNSFAKYINNPITVLGSDKYFKKPEDLRSRSGSKIGCGISSALSAEKNPCTKVGLNKSFSKPCIS